MIKYYWVERHDYRDMYPSRMLYHFDSEEIAKEYVSLLNETWNSGTVTLLLPALTEEEARHEIARLIWEERRNPKPDSEAYIDCLLITINEAYK